MKRADKLRKADALAFMLTHIVVEQGRNFELNPQNLFQLMNLAGTAVDQVTEDDNAIAHEVMEQIAKQFIDQLPIGQLKP
jgi:hypothetical protein